MSFEVSIPGDFLPVKKVEVSAFGSNNWNLQLIDYFNMKAKHNYGFGVKIGVIDSGYYPHPDLPKPLGVFAFGNKTADDDNGHGTHVFGIVASIAKNASYYVCRALDANGMGSNNSVTNAIHKLIELGVDIIQISIGGTKRDSALESAIKLAHAKGILIVCSSGNSGKDEKFYPAAFKECIAVGSIDRYGMVSRFSTIGDQVDIVAPGENIVSTWINDDMYASSGTSMASPHVSGVAALFIDHCRTEHGLKPSVDDLKKMIYSNCRDIGLIGWDKNSGNGIVQVQFHNEEKDKKVDIPLWLQVTLKVARFFLEWWIDKKTNKL